MADALSRKSRDGETDLEVLMEQLAQQFAIVRIDEVEKTWRSIWVLSN
jgi:hypothetical protein